MDLIPDWVPSGYKTVNLSLVVKDLEKALRWYNTVFGAQTHLELKSPEGELLFAQIKVFDAIIMVSSARLSPFSKDPATLGGTSSAAYLYVGDAEGIFDAALANGAEELMPLKEQFYGDKAGRFRDPFGHHWVIARQLEAVSVAEMQKRFESFF